MIPDWPAPPGVGALMSTRAGGVSAAPWDSLNLGTAVGDDPAAVAGNRARFAAATGGAMPLWLRQVHGSRVLRLRVDDVSPAPADPPEADAAVTAERGVACVVQVADCLPVLFAALNGRAVGAAHAGWRGLAGGVLESTLAEVCALADCAPDAVLAWLGPCIGPRSFEVGADVLRGFGADPDAAGTDPAFVPAPRPDGSARWLADLPALAHRRLNLAGLRQIRGGQWCTVQDRSRFFSFRRDGVTGRQAAAVWLR
ncbi:peptidoglycan editing factor PgeF [Azohydromonas aeria]|uniref:peptidoglycan editing factor PgeF n=1 Tax=Azohydromonas aeria TaxID=2590212 RepID=UPI001E4C69FF|nr:peptidoglycan editing factor PgeF [Azohydromonas aeria]